MKAFLILENGRVFEGKAIGADKDIICEVVFTTSMVGYAEQMTDPSFAGQAVCMTYPLIGNYGVCKDDLESKQIWLSGFIVRELSRIPSNFRSDLSIQEFLQEHGIPGISGIDTRALTKLLREKGTMNGMITRNPDYSLDDILPKLKAHKVLGVVNATSVKEKYLTANKDTSRWGLTPDIIKERKGAGKTVAVWDFGAKDNIVRSLHLRDCDVTVYPATAMAEDILSDKPNGIMLSNGPGDPKECTDIINEIRKVYESGVPVFAICLGHQLMALAAGLDTHKLKYGHRGGNHPVKDMETGNVYISSQNHGYVVDDTNLDPTIAVSYFRNVNDGTNEGLKYTDKPIYTVQFHPEACPGPQDTGWLFDKFIERI